MPGYSFVSFMGKLFCEICKFLRNENYSESFPFFEQNIVRTNVRGFEKKYAGLRNMCSLQATTPSNYSLMKNSPFLSNLQSWQKQ